MFGRQIVALVLGVSLGFAGSAIAATTISTNISTGGTLTVTGASYLTGAVGIGTTTPAGAFQITHAPNDDSAMVLNQTNDSTSLGTKSALHITNTDTTTDNWGVIGFGTDPMGSPSAKIGVQFRDRTNNYGDIALGTRNASGMNEWMRITSDGNVGIGTTSPYSLFSLSNNLNTTANTPLFTVASTTAGTATSTHFTILANGNVGIGTSSPSSILSIGGTPLITTDTSDGDNTKSLFLSGGGGNAANITRGAFLGLFGNQVDVDANKGSIQFTAGLGDGSSNVGDIRFSAGAGEPERMRITESGLVGIGTSTPIGLVQSTTNFPSLLINYVLTDNTAGADLKHWYMNSYAGNFLIGSIDDSYAGTVRLTIDSSGNVGIGTTTPNTRLHVSSGASATTTVSVGELGLTTSKACVNMNQADGSPGSFYLMGDAMVVEGNYCR